MATKQGYDETVRGSSPGLPREVSLFAPHDDGPVLKHDDAVAVRLHVADRPG